jgi:hypothetical protein
MTEVMGTTLFEDGKWLLRHEGGGGNKVSLSGPSEVMAQLKHDEAKIFEGTYSHDHRGNVIAAHVQAVKKFD